MILWTVQDQIVDVINPTLFLNTWYERGSFTAVDEPLGRFYSTSCPPDVLASGSVDRTCQCAKGAVSAGILYVATRPKRDNRNAPKDPKKPFAIAFTDIQSSTSLWGRIPEEMGPAVDTHHEIMRELIKEYKGYEVKTIGDSFMVAFHNAGSAVKFATSVQQRFFEHDWGTNAIDEVYRDLEREKAEEKAGTEKGLDGMAESIESPSRTAAASLGSSPLLVTNRLAFYPPGVDETPVENGRVASSASHLPPHIGTYPAGKDVQDVANKHSEADVHTTHLHPYMDSAALNSMDSKYWRGIRVRVGIHYGQGEIKHDPVTLGYDYYGTVVNTAARVEGVGNGGQVLLTEAAYEAALKDDAFKEMEASVTKLGPQPLRGLDQPVPLYQVIPAALKGREFHALRLDIEHDASDSDTEDEEVSSQVSGISADTTPEMMAHKMAHRWHPGNTEGYGQALSNVMLMFNFQEHLYAPSNEKGRKAAIEHLATKWRVPLRKSKKLPSMALWEHHLMQVLLKVYPGFEKKNMGLHMRIPIIRGETVLDAATEGGEVGLTEPAAQLPSRRERSSPHP